MPYALRGVGPITVFTWLPLFPKILEGDISHINLHGELTSHGEKG